MTKSAPCPKCGTRVEYETLVIFGRQMDIVPCCDDCEAIQTATFAENQRRENWKRLYAQKMPAGYQRSSPDQISEEFSMAMLWNPAKYYGGLGLVGQAGSGKSSALACVLCKLETPFLWWSGTEARDAAIEAATADKDREGANRRWEHAMRVPILVLDDVSQGKFTESWSSKMFDLLETRLSARLPTFWTCQIAIQEFMQKIISQNQGDVAQAQAITRRLDQHSLVLEMP